MLDEDQGVQALQADRVHMHEVDRENAVDLCGEELLPRRTRTPRCRIDAGVDPLPDGAATGWAAVLRGEAEAILTCGLIETVTLSGRRQYAMAVAWCEHVSTKLGTSTCHGWSPRSASATKRFEAATRAFGDRAWMPLLAMRIRITSSGATSECT
jgi:hypothetical protein